jgi:hypothetical protein
LLRNLLYSALPFGGLALAVKRWPILAEAAPNPARRGKVVFRPAKVVVNDLSHA